MKIHIIVGTRPNFIKIAPLVRIAKDRSHITYKIIHTGQHYDFEMDRIFFEHLDIPRADINLEVGSHTDATQTGLVMQRYDEYIRKDRPDMVVVLGDVNSTLGCALVAVKNHIPIAHIESGMRSFKKDMPEEINRICTDVISDILFTPTQSATKNLVREGIPRNRIYLVGHIMIDTLIMYRGLIEKSNILDSLGLENINYAIATIHRQSNVDNPENLHRVLKILNYIQRFITIVFPVHPRTKRRLKEFGLNIGIGKGLRLINPLGYLDFQKLLANCKFVITDSGGIQPESVYLNKPCITLRETTEWIETVESGLNFITGLELDNIKKVLDKIFDDRIKRRRIPKIWDGKTSQRILNILDRYLL